MNLTTDCVAEGCLYPIRRFSTPRIGAEHYNHFPPAVPRARAHHYVQSHTVGVVFLFAQFCSFRPHPLQYSDATTCNGRGVVNPSLGTCNCQAQYKGDHCDQCNTCVFGGRGLARNPSLREWFLLVFGCSLAAIQGNPYRQFIFHIA